MQVFGRLRKLCELCAQFVLLHEICFNLQMNLWPTRLFIGSFIAVRWQSWHKWNWNSLAPCSLSGNSERRFTADKLEIVCWRCRGPGNCQLAWFATIGRLSIGVAHWPEKWNKFRLFNLFLRIFLFAFIQRPHVLKIAKWFSTGGFFDSLSNSFKRLHAVIE